MKGATHFVGIGGTGLSAIARVLLERGIPVSGSDHEDSSALQGLRAAGAQVHVGHAAANVNGALRVIRSSAIGDDNIEVQTARAKGVPVLKRSEILGELLADQQVIAVAGSHGKTTTTAMIAWMLTALNQRPGFIIGSTATNLGANAAAGAGRLFVIEADEYDYMFLGLAPQIAVVTNVEYDHPDLFPTRRDFRSAFEQFVERLKPDGVLIGNREDGGASALLDYAKGKGLAVRSFAHGHSRADYSVLNLDEAEQGFAFTVLRGKERLAEINLNVPGLHNAMNALAALVVADVLGLSVAEAAMALGDFRGTARRFDVRGEAGGVIVVDDYAHHPTEIRSTLAAARARFRGRRLVAVWQPHTFSRTLALQSDFVSSFGEADYVLVTDVYAARERRPAGFDMQPIVDSIPGAIFANDLEVAQAKLAAALKPGDVLIVMSAGDAITLSERVYQNLKQQEEQHA